MANSILINNIMKDMKSYHKLREKKKLKEREKKKAKGFVVDDIWVLFFGEQEYNTYSKY